MRATKEEARKLWCFMKERGDIWCDGPACMAWEWVNNAVYGDERDDTPDRRGYCGLTRRDK